MSGGWDVVAGAAIGYLVGTFPTADVVARLVTRGEVDLRHAGSGNPGGLNAARVLGRKWGALVIVADAAKGAIAGFLGLVIGDAAAYAAGTAVIAGHCWPVWQRFRGGRGVAAAGGSYFSVFPPWVLLGGGIAGVTAFVTKRARVAVAVASFAWIAGAALWWAAGWPNWWGPTPAAGLLVYAVLGTGMVLLKFARRGGGL
jgi:glycerol-3-phosphate acyltransferase PlsY